MNIYLNASFNPQGTRIQAKAYAAWAKGSSAVPFISQKNYIVNPSNLRSLCAYAQRNVATCFKFVLDKRRGAMVFEGLATLGGTHAEHLKMITDMWGDYAVDVIHASQIGGFAYVEHNKGADSFNLTFYGFSLGCIHHEVQDDEYRSNDGGQWGSRDATNKLISVLRDVAEIISVETIGESFKDPETQEATFGRRITFRFLE